MQHVQHLYLKNYENKHYVIANPSVVEGEAIPLSIDPTNIAIKTMKKSIIAFTLIEVLIFCSIVSTFFVSSAAITTFLLRSMKANEHKIIATRYAEELLEWVRAEKEKNWKSTITGNFNQSPVASTGPANVILLTGTLLGEAPNKIYNRKTEEKDQVTIDSEVVQKTITVTVEWAEGNTKHSVNLDTIVGIWER